MMRMLIAVTGLIAAASIASPAPVRAGGDPAKGRETAIKHCARCHVIADYNPHGSLGSTASFKSLTGGVLCIFKALCSCLRQERWPP